MMLSAYPFHSYFCFVVFATVVIILPVQSRHTRNHISNICCKHCDSFMYIKLYVRYRENHVLLCTAILYASQFSDGEWKIGECWRLWYSSTDARSSSSCQQTQQGGAFVRLCRHAIQTRVFAGLQRPLVEVLTINCDLYQISDLRKLFSQFELFVNFSKREGTLANWGYFFIATRRKKIDFRYRRMVTEHSVPITVVPNQPKFEAVVDFFFLDRE